jgi:hypothetical protein
LISINNVIHTLLVISFIFRHLLVIYMCFVIFIC